MIPTSKLCLLSLATELVVASALNFPFPSSTEPEPFKIAVESKFVEETLQKVSLYRRSRDLDDATPSDWSDGPPRQNMTSLAAYWRESYSWRNTEQEINTNFSHYAITIPGSSGYDHPVPLHFVHERSEDSDAIPLLLIHGWPSSHLEWSKIIKPLTAPGNWSHPRFHIVAPDMPGFGFSPAPTHAGFGPREMGMAFHQLMQELGYENYGLYSTDLGWFTGMWMAADAGDNIVGHMSDFFVVSPTPSDLDRDARNETTSVESKYIASFQAWFNGHAGYSVIQSQAPLTIAQALSDTPVGFAGWIWHLMHTVSDGYQYSFDELITSTLMLWIQGTYGNLRAYKEFQTVRASPVH